MLCAQSALADGSYTKCADTAACMLIMLCIQQHAIARHAMSSMCGLNSICSCLLLLAMLSFDAMQQMAAQQAVTRQHEASAEPEWRVAAAKKAAAAAAQQQQQQLDNEQQSSR
jgi:hypothetical protein